MTKIEVELPDELYRSVLTLAAQTGRDPSDVVRAAIQNYEEVSQPKAKRMSIKDIPPGRSLGKILKPSTTREELLEDFFDDRH
ncbi:ribbon-helix-helix protein, CopG family [Anatilimnocola floriformis]|uniref:ribbon-helix-helix protein, CopG family n=1 Tax=Anatilimnocola floriformis TaxID=2948575 RepID=UPI0020C1EFDB|nr:ribbon-helix-helix protein, CopG family [Anatilimnocola floriformis]